MRKLDIQKYRGNGSTNYTGRPQGKSARKELELDKLDSSDEVFEIVIPIGTTSFNPSFFLGLFFDSVKKLTLEGFRAKYNIVIPEQDTETMSILKANLDDGFRNALNELNKKVGFHHLFS